MNGESSVPRNGSRLTIDGAGPGDRPRGAPPPRPGRPRRGAVARALPPLLALLALATSGAATLLALAWLGRQAARLPVPWAGAAGGAAFLLVLAWVLASGRPRARRVARDDHLRARRVAVYGGLVDLLGGDPGRAGAAALWPLERQLALLGSPAVLACYARLLDPAEPAGGAGGDDRLGPLIAAMRRDVLPGRSRVEPATLARLARRPA